MPYKMCAACNSPLTTLSRTEAHEASFDGVILMPYFLSKPISAATTIGAQSVSGMKPIFTSVISGASEPAAQALVLMAVGTKPINAAAPKAPAAVLRKKSRRLLSTVLVTALSVFLSEVLSLLIMLISLKLNKLL